MPAEKLCKMCGETKATTEFWRAARSADGLQYWCRACHRIAIKRSEEKRKERNRARWAAEDAAKAGGDA